MTHARFWLILVGAVAAVIAVGLASASGADDADDTPDLSLREVTYRVTGGGGADITMQIGGATTQRSRAALPMDEVAFVALPGEFLYISAQRTRDNQGSVECSIEVDGVTIEEARSVGPYVIASCSATAP